MKRFAIALSLTVLAAGPVAAETAVPSGPAQPASEAQDMDIRLFIQEVARLTDMTFIVDQRVRGVVPATRFGPASRDEILDLFVSTLRASGVEAVPSVGGAYRIFPARDPVQRTSARNGRGSDGAVRL
jgi:general secretion pathway protein D